MAASKKVDGSFKAGNLLHHRRGRDGYKELKFLVNVLAKTNVIDFEIIFCFFLQINKKLGVAVFAGIFFLGTEKMRLRYGC